MKKGTEYSESIKECDIYPCELRGKRTKRFISNLSSDTKFSFEEIVGKIGVGRDWSRLDTPSPTIDSSSTYGPHYPNIRNRCCLR